MVDAPPSPSLVSAFIGVLLAPVVTLLTAWAIGHRLAARWSLWQKHREQTLAATSEFYRLYGEFFAVWKLWNNSVRQSTAVGQDDRRWNLLERAAAAEASMETIMLKLASERILSEADLATLGRFRQAFQYLRDVIRQREELGLALLRTSGISGLQEARRESVTSCFGGRKPASDSGASAGVADSHYVEQMGRRLVGAPGRAHRRHSPGP